MNKICLTFIKSAIVYFILLSILGGIRYLLMLIFFSHNKTVAFKYLKMALKYQFSAAQALKGLLSNSTRKNPQCPGSQFEVRGSERSTKIMCNLPCEGLGLQKVGVGQCE